MVTDMNGESGGKEKGGWAVSKVSGNGLTEASFAGRSQTAVLLLWGRGIGSTYNAAIGKRKANEVCSPGGGE